ncbi:MAG: hypothetical protein Q8P24_11285, partial [Desulfobacterales bacterium]|nr:hypothetical protein [Desulfobacterales bacterium]
MRTERPQRFILHSIGEMERQAMAVFERARKKSHTENRARKKRIRRGVTSQKIRLVGYHTISLDCAKALEAPAFAG